MYHWYNHQLYIQHFFKVTARRFCDQTVMYDKVSRAKCVLIETNPFNVARARCVVQPKRVKLSIETVSMVTLSSSVPHVPFFIRHHVQGRLLSDGWLDNDNNSKRKI